MDDKFIMLTGVRNSYPHLFVEPVINGETGKKGAKLMLKKGKQDAQIKKLKDRMTALLKEKNKGKKLPSEKYCLRDGDDSGKDEYEGYMTVSANTSGDIRVLAGDGKTVVTESRDSKIYAGCFVNAKIRLWFQDNNFGKRINAELIAIQFAGDGEPLTDSHISEEDAVDGFDAVDGDIDDAGGAEEDHDDLLD